MKLLPRRAMAVLVTPLAIASMTSGQTSSPPGEPALVSEPWRAAVERSLAVAGDNAATWLEALQDVPADQREGLAFLLAHMPPRDLRGLSGDHVLENVALAYQVRDEVPWGRDVPVEVFLNDVLPYAVLNERRDRWRADFHGRFLETAREAGSIEQAVLALNREVFDTLGVQYHATRRPKPDQSPYESIEAGYASCTGLSIMLTGALRSVGVPARIAGTPLWTDGSGNHTWVEVWIDDAWHHVGAAEPGPLDSTWFDDKAARADATRPEHRIYASSWAPTGASFPLVWDTTIDDVHAVDVTARYGPSIDLARETDRQVVVDREPGQYLGHPSTVLLEDGRTMLVVYPKGHGRGAIVLKRSTDGGLTWSDRLPVPKTWATSRETPTIHRVVDPHDGTKRLILFSGLHPIRMAVSSDDGVTWSELQAIGDYGGIVAMASVFPLADGRYAAQFHDDGRFLRGGGDPTAFHVYQVLSADGGLTWSRPVVVASHESAHLCEPGVVRSPDGAQLAALLRENSRKYESFVIFSGDEAATWSAPRQVNPALTGDRHTARYAPDGRLVISFRDTRADSPTAGDWIAWVGRYEDIAAGNAGRYRVRLMDNHHRWDCAYPGMELLPDGTFVATTYGHWTAGEQPYIVSVRFTLDELDRRAAR